MDHEIRIPFTTTRNEERSTGLGQNIINSPIADDMNSGVEKEALF